MRGLQRGQESGGGGQHGGDELSAGQKVGGKKGVRSARKRTLTLVCMAICILRKPTVQSSGRRRL